MEPIAENTTTVTKPLFLRAMQVADDYRRKALRGIGLLAGLWVALLAFTVFIGMPLGIAMMELLVIGAVGAWLLVFYPRTRGNAAFQAMERKYGGDLTRHITFYPDRLTVETSVSTAEFTYHEMIRIRTAQNVMVLTTADNTGIFFSLDGFTMGDAQTVKAAVEKVIL